MNAEHERRVIHVTENFRNWATLYLFSELWDDTGSKISKGNNTQKRLKHQKNTIKSNSGTAPKTECTKIPEELGMTL